MSYKEMHSRRFPGCLFFFFVRITHCSTTTVGSMQYSIWTQNEALKVTFAMLAVDPTCVQIRCVNYNGNFLIFCGF